MYSTLMVISYLLRGVLEPVSDDDWQESTKPVKNCDDSDLYTAMDPALDVLGGLFDVGTGDMSVATRVRFCALRSLPHDVSVFIVEKVSRFVVFWYKVDTR